MSENNKQNSLSFMSVLQLILITLKLLKCIDWPWPLVLWPIWLELIIVIILIWRYLK